MLTKETHREHCNVWYGDADVDENGVYEPPKDICDDWTPLGDPVRTAADSRRRRTERRRPAATSSVVEPAWDGQTLWAATQFGRVLVSKNAGGPEAAVVFDRIDDDPTALPNAPNRFVSAIYVDPKDPNHAWIAYSGFNAKDPIDGHVFEVRYVPGARRSRCWTATSRGIGWATFRRRRSRSATAGTIYVGTDYGCVASKGDGVWRECGTGLPRMPVADLAYVRDQSAVPGQENPLRRHARTGCLGAEDRNVEKTRTDLVGLERTQWRAARGRPSPVR